MKAIVATGKGGSEVLEPQDVPLPWPAGSGEVLVRLRAAAVNPADVFFRRLGGYVERPGPFILGHDGAGTVEAVGAEVAGVTPGDRVCFCYGGIGAAYGTYAQYAVIPADLLAIIPAEVDFVTAAALPLVFITLAESLHDRADVKAGEFALIHGGAGLGWQPPSAALGRLRWRRTSVPSWLFRIAIKISSPRQWTGLVREVSTWRLTTWAGTSCVRRSRQWLLTAAS